MSIFSPNSQSLYTFYNNPWVQSLKASNSQKLYTIPAYMYVHLSLTPPDCEQGLLTASKLLANRDCKQGL